MGMGTLSKENLFQKQHPRKMLPSAAGLQGWLEDGAALAKSSRVHKLFTHMSEVFMDKAHAMPVSGVR